MPIAETIENYLESFTNKESSIYKDLALNFKKLMTESTLDEPERVLSLLSLAITLEDKALIDVGVELAKSQDFTVEQIVEAKESAAIMGMLNTYYKFRSYLPGEVLEHYQKAGLRMQSLMKPQNGKMRFEMMAMAVSVANGCPSCIASHEKALFDLTVPREKIHDLARLAAVVKGIATLRSIAH